MWSRDVPRDQNIHSTTVQFLWSEMGSRFGGLKKTQLFLNRRIKGSLVYVLSHFMPGKGMDWVSFCPILARYDFRGQQ